jgi:hypothetical protein
MWSDLTPQAGRGDFGLRDQAERVGTRRLSGVAFLEVRGDVVERLVAPSLCFGEQLPAILGMKCCSLTIQGFHRTAVNELFHRHLPDQVGDILSPVLRRCHYDYATGRLPYRLGLDNLRVTIRGEASEITFLEKEEGYGKKFKHPAKARFFNRLSDGRRPDIEG